MAANRLLCAIDEMFTGTGYRPMPLVPPALVPACRPATAPCSSSNASKADRQACDRRWSDMKHLPHVVLPDDDVGPLKEGPAG